MAYIASHENQNWLLPLSINDMIPADHICFMVEELVGSLNFSPFDMIYDGAGHPAYHPRIIIKILIQGMLSRVRSSRKLASACRENFVFMFLAEKVFPDFRTIARFRAENPSFIKEVFRKTIELATEHDLIDLSFVCIDGSMMKASAGKRKHCNKKSLDILDSAIDRLIEEDITLDKLENELFDNKEDGLTGVDRHDLKKLVREYAKRKNKGMVKQKINVARCELEINQLRKVSLTDPTCRMMQNKKAYTEPSFNVQVSVSKNQIIIANDVCQDGHDAHQFIPQIQNIRENLILKNNTKVGVDCGYSDGKNIKFAEDNNINLYVPSRAQAQEFDDKKQSLNHDKYEYDAVNDELIAEGIRYPYHHSYNRKNNGKKILVYQLPGAKQRKQVPEFFRERLRMRDKMIKPKSQQVYRLRKTTVEPVIGNIKENLGFREFILRSLDKVKVELNLACIAHNLQKIWRARAITSC